MTKELDVRYYQVAMFVFACFLLFVRLPAGYFFSFAESFCLRQAAGETSCVTLLNCLGKAVFFIYVSYVEKGKNKLQPWQQLSVVADFHFFFFFWCWQM